ncbi:hypothetical protein [Pseudomonas chlororaphis]|uniref:hypothetical protein n=1 Tax=Pseudomonas chlororaphis TaxID=587753 RepID=UPI0039832F60
MYSIRWHAFEFVGRCEAALMELTLQVEAQGHAEVGDNVRGALYTIGENAGHIKQGLARLKKLP